MDTTNHDSQPVGILIGGGANNNAIGGNSSVVRNLIAGNLGAGVCFISFNDNTVTNNVIGPDANSSFKPGNGGDGWLAGQRHRAKQPHLQ